MDIAILSRPPRKRAGRRSTHVTPPTVAPPEVPIWFVCTLVAWRDACGRGTFDIKPSPRDGCRRFRVALHGEVSRLALATFGACRTDLVAIAIDPRRLDGTGTATRVGLNLDATGRAALWVDASEIETSTAIAHETLSPLPDEAGYREPSMETAGDRERKRNRDGLRRTR